jgi:hypothetical protein
MKGATSRWYLEGDERFYVDDNQSPVYHGTGTEDFYNGAWYFQNDVYNQPMSGNPTHTADSSYDKTACYRFFLQDAIAFRNHIRAGIEHGGTNDADVEVWTLAYYYHKPNLRTTITDTLDVGNSASESSHSYVINTPTFSGTRTYTYEGDFDDVGITDDARAFKGYSQFRLTINSANAGVILRRRIDQSVKNQKARVYVDGALAGTWYKAGGNISHNYRDEEFMIPASFTSGKSQILVKVEFVSSDNDWNEFRYLAYSCQTGTGPTPAPSPTPSATPTPLPILTDNFDDGDLVGWTTVSGTWTNPGTVAQGVSAGDGFIMRSETGGDFTYEADFKMVTTGSAGILIFRSNNNASASYALALDSNSSFIKLYRWPYATLSTYNQTFTIGTWYHLKVVASGSNFKVYFNGSATPCINQNDSTYTSGQFGLASWNGTMQVDNVKATR